MLTLSTRQPTETDEEYRRRLMDGFGGRGANESDEAFRQRLFSRVRPGMSDETRRRTIEANRLSGETYEAAERRLIGERRIPLETAEQTRVRLAREGALLGESAGETRRRLARESFLSPETLYPSRRALIDRSLLPDETPEETRLRLLSQNALPIETNDEAFLRRGETIRLPGESEESALRRLQKKDALEREGLLPGKTYDDARRRIAMDQLRPGETQQEMRERLAREGRVPAEGFLPGETIEDVRRRMANQGLLVDADVSDMMLSSSVLDRVRRMSVVIRADARYATITKWVDAADKPIGNVGDRLEQASTLELIDKSTAEELTVFIPNNLLWSYIIDAARANGGLARYGGVGRLASFFAVRGRVDIGAKSFAADRSHRFASINGADELHLFKDSAEVVRIEGSTPLKLVPYGRTLLTRSVQYESDKTKNGRYYVLEPFSNVPTTPPLPNALTPGDGRNIALPPPIAQDEFESAESEARNRGWRKTKMSSANPNKKKNGDKAKKNGKTVETVKSKTHQTVIDDDVVTLQRVLVANHLERALFSQPSGTFTIFAPTADVFKNASRELEAMTPHERRQLLKYHVLRGDFDRERVAQLFLNRASEATLDDGQRLTFASGEPGSYVGRIYASDLIEPDRLLYNKRGERHYVRVHFIRRLLAPRDAPFLTIMSERRGYDGAHGVPQHGPPGTVKPGTFANPTIGATHRQVSEPSSDVRVIDVHPEQGDKAEWYDGRAMMMNPSSGRGALLLDESEARRKKPSMKFSSAKLTHAKFEDLANIYALLRAAELTPALFSNGSRRFTLFAPTTSAFGAAEDLFNSLEFGQQQMLLEYHVLEGDYDGMAVAGLFGRQAEVTMLSGQALTFSGGSRPRGDGDDARGYIYGDEIVSKDLDLVDSAGTQNRIRVHLISVVLLPADDDDDDDGDDDDGDDGDDYDEQDADMIDETETHRGKNGRYMHSTANKNAAASAQLTATGAVDTSAVAISTASKASFGVKQASTMADASEHHEKLVRTLQNASSGDEAAKAVQTFAAAVGPLRSTANAGARDSHHDEAWGELIHKAREALAVNNRLQPSEKKPAHGELTRLQQI